MNYSIRWDMLGEPADVGGAVMRGLEYGSALRRRNEEEERRSAFQQSAMKAYDPATGQVNAPAMWSAFAAAGNIEGAMQFDRSQAETQAAQQTQQRESLLNLARLLDDANDPESYARGLAVAQRMGLDVSSAPPQYDPQWVEQQRLMVREFIERPQQMTTFMREAAAAGIEPGSDEFREVFRNRYAALPRIVTGPNGELLVVGGGGNAPASGDTAPPELTDDEIRALDAGGPTPGASGTFPGY